MNRLVATVADANEKISALNAEIEELKAAAFDKDA